MLWQWDLLLTEYSSGGSNMVKFSTTDIMSVGLLILSIWIFIISLSLNNFSIKLLGIISSIIIFGAEVTYLIQWVAKK